MSGPAARFTPWRGSRRGDIADAIDRAGVRLVAEPARAPATPIEQLLVETLVAKGPLSRTALVSAVARARYRDELAQSGWLASLDFFSESVFIAEVTRALDGARGVLWEFEPAVVTG